MVATEGMASTGAIVVDLRQVPVSVLHQVPACVALEKLLVREPIADQHVLIVEDIVDTGRTLSYLYEVLRGRKPASLHTCVLVRKERENLDVPVEYLGFSIPDVWVVGYGLDYADRYRTLPYVAELKREIYAG